MTGEEMERAIAFIIEQRSQFAANQQRHEENFQRHEDAMRRIEAAQEQSAQQITHLGAAMIELSEAHARTEETVKALADKLAETDGKLDVLIDTVERHISEGHGGKG